MGKPIVPPHDPARLARVMDEKKRMIGVDRAALDAQIAEKEVIKARQREQDRAYSQAADWLDARLVGQAEEAERQRRARDASIDAARRQQEEERAARESGARAAEEAAAAAEQAAARASPWLNEAPERSVSAADPNRWRPDHFKGSSPAQRSEVLATQAAQVVEKHAAAEAERAREAAAAAQQAALLGVLAQQTAAAEAQRKAEHARMAAELQRMAAEKAMRDAALEARAKDNKPSAAYFGQWGTSHR